MTKENQITIGYDKISSDYLTINGHESPLVLALLSRHYSIRKEIVFNFKYLYNKLGIPLNKMDRRERIVHSVNGIFGTCFDPKTNINDILTIPYEIDKDQYLVIADSEVDAILSYRKRIDKYSLFNTYINIKRYINYQTGISYPSIKTLMSNTLTVSNNTILKYIKILEELGMITCNRKDEYIITDNGMKRPNNEYKII